MVGYNYPFYFFIDLLTLVKSLNLLSIKIFRLLATFLKMKEMAIDEIAITKQQLTPASTSIGFYRPAQSSLFTIQLGFIQIMGPCMRLMYLKWYHVTRSVSIDLTNFPKAIFQ